MVVFLEELNRSIDRGQTDPWILLLSEVVDLARMQVSVIADYAKQEPPFWGDLLSHCLQEPHCFWNIHRLILNANDLQLKKESTTLGLFCQGMTIDREFK